MAEGKTCAECGGEIGSAVYRYRPLLKSGYDGTTYRTKPTTDVDPLCEECAPEWLPELQTRVYELHMYSHKDECETCGREVFFVSGTEHTPTRVFCCDDCKTKGATKSRRSAPHVAVCEVCGEEFTAKRNDAKTCSPKCRQRAYRQRLQV